MFIAKGSLTEEVAKVVGQAIPAFTGDCTKHNSDKEPQAYVPEGTEVSGELNGEFLLVKSIGGVVIDQKDVYCLAEHLKAA